MLAIVPGYDEELEDSPDSEGEGQSSDVDVEVNGQHPKPPLKAVSSPKTVQTRKTSGLVDVPQASEGTLSDQNITSNRLTGSIDSGDDVSRGMDLFSGHPPSCSGLSSEQKSKYLALKKRKDEELRQLEEAEGLEGRRMARKRRKGRKGKGTRDSAAGGSSGSVTPTEDMNTLSSYLGVNDHLRGASVDHGDLGPKSGLEKEIDLAVAAGDIDKAEQLSNYLACRNFGVRVAEAANARDYAKRKQEEEEKRLAKKKQKKAKLAWGFEVKHRWEMKGNM